MRDTVLLDLPLAPHCDEPCDPTPSGRRRPTKRSDPRWAVLSELELDPAAVSTTERKGARHGRPQAQDPSIRTHSRRSANRRLVAPARSLCPNCGAVKLPHVVCPSCGWYKGRQAIEVD